MNQYKSKYYSQHGEDFLLEKIFPDKKGFFVEIGCIDGKMLSNTLHFEKKGWNGICIEAHPDYIDRLVINRPNSIVVHAAITSHDIDEIIFYAKSEVALSSLEKPSKIGYREYSVQGKSLTTVLSECNAKKIDFISIDIEGFESEALQGTDFTKFKPRVWVIECDDLKAKRKIDKILFSLGYYFIGMLFENAFYSLDKGDKKLIEKKFVNIPLTHTQYFSNSLQIHCS